MTSSEQIARAADRESESETEATGEGAAMDVESDVPSAQTTEPEVAGHSEPQAQAAESHEELREQVVAAIKTCYDPEIPVDIYELGLIYEIDIRDAGVAYVKMTLTSPMCPVAEILPLEVEEKVRSVEGVSNVNLDLVWDPPWDIEMMSEAARLELNF